VLINSRRELWSAGKRPTKNAKLTFFFGGKKTWNFNTSAEPSEKTYRDVRKVYQFQKTESYVMFSTEKLKSPDEVPELRNVAGSFYREMEKLANTMHESLVLSSW